MSRFLQPTMREAVQYQDDKKYIQDIMDILPEDVLYKQIMLTNEMMWSNKIKKPKIEKWLNNFTGEVDDHIYEKRIALWLLLNYVYYNEEEVRHLCKALFNKFIHYQIKNNKDILGEDIKSTLSNLLSRVCFSYLGQPSESSAYMLYYFRQENDLMTDYFPKNIERLPKSIDTIIYIDDVTISGSQAGKYLERDISNNNNINNYFLLTLISAEEALKQIKQSEMEVISCIQLEEHNKCFSTKSMIFINMEEHIEKAKKIAKEYGKSLYPRHPLGYKNGEYAFGFFYNTPDNTLPIFWSDVNGWNPIMKRHLKITWRKEYGFGRFL